MALFVCIIFFWITNQTLFDTGGDIFDLDKLFVPLNDGNRHWRMAVVFMLEKRIAVYDSLRTARQLLLNYAQNLLRYLRDEHMEKKKVDLPDWKEWKLEAGISPRQPNSRYNLLKGVVYLVLWVTLLPISCTFLPNRVFQSNWLMTGYDCGMYVCMNADYIARDWPLDSKAEYGEVYRQHIALSILNGKVMTYDLI